MDASLLPGFDVEGGFALALARGLFVATLLAAFGAALFAVWVLPRALADADADAAARADQLLHRLARLAVLSAWIALPCWLVAQTADMAGAAGVRQALGAVPKVLAVTAFGHLLLVQAGLLVAAGLALKRRGALSSSRLRLATALLAIATAMQAGHGHAWAMYGRPSWLLLFGVLHLLAAGGWLGGLLPLLLLVLRMPAKTGAAAARWFSPLGKWCVGGIVASSLVQFWQLIGGLAGLVGTAYGWIAGLKIALLGVLFGFAVLNRYRLAPALVRAAPEAARARLVGSIAIQAGFGLLTVAAASVLSSLPPAMHVQPLWPFPERLSFDTINEDVGFRNEVLGAALAITGALLSVLAAILLRRRARWGVWIAAPGAALVLWFMAPHLNLLLVEAYPTSFYHSPTGFTATAIARGATLFPDHCAACHGAEGRGDGPAAKGLPVPPANLTAAHLWMHSDGELFWWLTHGIQTPEGAAAMPAFANVLSPDERWALIDYVRAHNAGLVAHSSGMWMPSVKAPDLQANCAGSRVVSLADFRGRFVRLVFGTAPPLPVADVPVILVTTGPALPPAPGLCVASGDTISRAYAIISGTALAELPGTQFLVDGSGWLRAMRNRHTTQPSWDDADDLKAELHQLQAHPVTMDMGMDHMHMAM